MGTVLTSNESLTLPEIQALFASAANLTNQHPLAVQNFTEDTIRSITPNDLLLGRNRHPINPNSNWGNDDDLPLRVQTIKEMEELWWNLWMQQVFPALVPYRRWSHTYRNVRIGDIVLVKYASKVTKGDFRLARVIHVHPDKHGAVRTITVAMRPRDSREKIMGQPPYLAPKPLQELQLGVQRVAVIVPVENQGNTYKPPDDPEHHQDEGLEVPVPADPSQLGDLEDQASASPAGFAGFSSDEVTRATQNRGQLAALLQAAERDDPHEDAVGKETGTLA